MPPQRAKRTSTVRKIVEMDVETWRALHALAGDRMATFQELVDESFRDLLKKHHQPVTLREALRASSRIAPANDGLANGRPKGDAGSESRTKRGSK
jgi:hypothetical protein